MMNYLKIKIDGEQDISFFGKLLTKSNAVHFQEHCVEQMDLYLTNNGHYVCVTKTRPIGKSGPETIVPFFCRRASHVVSFFGHSREAMLLYKDAGIAVSCSSCGRILLFDHAIDRGLAGVRLHCAGREGCGHVFEISIDSYYANRAKTRED